jgi:hypothetical protein
MSDLPKAGIASVAEQRRRALEIAAGTRAAAADEPTLWLTPATAARLHLIECLVAHYGSVNRAVLGDACGLAPAQVSRDLALYQQLAPANLVFDGSSKTYLRGAGFTRLWP